MDLNTRDSALNLLKKFINNGLSNYSSDRNYDYGPQNRTNTSNLSPFIKRRVIHEAEVIKECLNYFKYSKIEKFIQEVFWRTYWKGWLEGRPKVWENYKKDIKGLKESHSFGIKKKIYLSAIEGTTGIDCYDFWVKELIDYGYLHNHSRMWMSSIWVHTLNLPWQLGADFFLNNLLDADPASNTLSWRWVTGIHTRGKSYLASEQNINKYTQNRFIKKKNLSKKSVIPNFEDFIFEKKRFTENLEFSKEDILLINSNYLNYSLESIEFCKNFKVCLLENSSNNESNKIVKKFSKKSVEDYLLQLKKKSVRVETFENEKDFLKFLFINKVKNVYSFYPGIGRQLDILTKLAKNNNLKLYFKYDQFDKLCWPYASSGFFKFKKEIPRFIENI